MSKLWTIAETMPFFTPWRAATVLRVVDGDTMDLLVELGFDALVKTRIRLLTEGVVTTPFDKKDDGVDAWETRGIEREEGLKAKARTKVLLASNNGKVRIWSRKGGSRGKYGRWLACILYWTPKGWLSLGDTLIEEGHAEYWGK